MLVTSLLVTHIWYIYRWTSQILFTFSVQTLQISLFQCFVSLLEVHAQSPKTRRRPEKGKSDISLLGQKLGRKIIDREYLAAVRSYKRVSKTNRTGPLTTEIIKLSPLPLVFPQREYTSARHAKMTPARGCLSPARRYIARISP